MAKSKSFFGLRRGSTKSQTFSVLRGQQITKDRVSDVANPRSKAQMSQRASFADVVKFYKHANQNLFKFAFEGKKDTESDYNAFVRLNVGKAVIINKLQQDNVNFPAIGDNWQLAEGSLPECGIIKHVSQGPSGMLGTQYALSVPSIKPVDYTMGQLSTALIADYGLQLNDIVTICYVTTTVMSLNSVPTEAPKWEVLQFRINPDDETPMLDYKLGVSRGASGEVVWNVDAQGLSYISLYAEGFSVIFSRVQQGQPLKVSNAFLHNSATASQMIADAKMGFYRSSALTSWGAANEAILQGSLSEKVEPTPPTPPTPPVVGGDINVRSLELSSDGVESDITTVVDLSSIKAGDSITVSVDGGDVTLPYDTKVGDSYRFGNVDSLAVSIAEDGMIYTNLECTLVSILVSNTIHEFVYYEPQIEDIKVSNLALTTEGVTSSNILQQMGRSLQGYEGATIRVHHGYDFRNLAFNAGESSHDVAVFADSDIKVSVQLFDGEKQAGTLYASASLSATYVNITNGEAVRNFVVEE